MLLLSRVWRPLLSCMLLHAAQAHPIKRSTSQAVVTDFADPSILKVGDTWWAFATSTENVNTQIASSTDFDTWTKSSKDALPNLPAWVNTAEPEVWAPDLIQRVSDDMYWILNKDMLIAPTQADGTFVMYFSAASSQDPDLHCVGTATSTSIDGPYTPAANPLVCPLAQGGAIDASGFKDADGTAYVVYKVDGNSIGHGGVCNNMVSPQVPTPIMLQPMAADAVTPVGAPIQILDRDNNDGPLVEAPSLVRSADGTYFLFFSSNCWDTENYDVTWATASAITGPYTKRGPLYVQGTNGLDSPGGMDIDPDGQHMLFHANVGDSRQLYTAQVSLQGTQVVG